MEFLFINFGFCGMCLGISSTKGDVAAEEFVLLEIDVAGTCVGYTCASSKGVRSWISQLRLFNTLNEDKVFMCIKTVCACNLIFWLNW